MDAAAKGHSPLVKKTHAYVTRICFGGNARALACISLNAAGPQPNGLAPECRLELIWHA